MSSARFWIAASIIAVVIIGGFALSVPHTTEIKPTLFSESSSTPSVSVHDSYKKGVHTLTGAVTAPNACTQVSATASLVGGTTTPAIEISINIPSSSGICLELPTSQSFKLTLSAPQHVPIRATINGKAASTTP